MKQSQAEIKAIQEKLRAIQANRSAGRSALPAMVEMMPTTSTATVTRPQNEAPLTAVAERLQQQSTSYLNQLRSPHHSPAALASPQTQDPLSHQEPEPPFAQAFKRLEMQAQRINQLSAVQEAAMLEWKAIAEQLERDRQAAELAGDFWDGVDVEASKLCEFLTTAVPYIERDEEGLFVLTTRSVDLFRAEREATAMAQTLRHRSGQTVSKPRVSKPRGRAVHQHHTSSSLGFEAVAQSIWQSFSGLLESLTPAKKPPSLKSTRSRPTQAQTSAVEVPTFSWQDAGMWVLGSVIVRVVLNLFLVANPGMWLPVIAMIATPAAIAVYRTTVAPQSGLLWGYRLFLIMIGLLLGGRL